jgi:hypothetical protein
MIQISIMRTQKAVASANKIQGAIALSTILAAVPRQLRALQMYRMYRSMSFCATRFTSVGSIMAILHAHAFIRPLSFVLENTRTWHRYFAVCLAPALVAAMQSQRTCCLYLMHHRLLTGGLYKVGILYRRSQKRQRTRFFARTVSDDYYGLVI